MTKDATPSANVDIEPDYDTPEGVRAALLSAKKGDVVAREGIARRLTWIIGGELPYTESEVEELIGIAEAGWNSILGDSRCHPEDMFQYAVDILWDDAGDLIAENAADGAAWMLRAAEAGHPDAQLEIGRFYFEGVGVKKSDSLAAEWLSKAAKDELNAEHAEFFLDQLQKKSGKKSSPKAKKPVAKKPAAKKAPAKKATKAAPAKKAASAKTKKIAPKKAVAKASVKKAPAKKPAAKVAAKTKPAAKSKVVKKAAKPTAKKTTGPVAKKSAKKAPAKKTVAKRK